MWTSPATRAGAPDASAGRRVVDEARRYLGVPYLWGGTDPEKGLDCSGLVQLVYGKLGIDLPRVSYQQATAGRPVAGLADARPGDILAFDSPVDHVAIYIGNNKMIEAPRTGLDVRVIDVYEKPTAIRRVLPDAPVASTGPRVRSPVLRRSRPGRRTPPSSSGPPPGTGSAPACSPRWPPRSPASTPARSATPVRRA